MLNKSTAFSFMFSCFDLHSQELVASISLPLQLLPINGASGEEYFSPTTTTYTQQASAISSFKWSSKSQHLTWSTLIHNISNKHPLCHGSRLQDIPSMFTSASYKALTLINHTCPSHIPVQDSAQTTQASKNPSYACTSFS